MLRFDPKKEYVLSGRTLCDMQDIYELLINDDGTPKMAIKGDFRRDLAQSLSAALDRAEELLTP